MPAKIFISHSLGDDTALLDEVCSALNGDGYGYDLLVDRTALQPGDPWNKTIHRWLDECHAAVILVSRAALTSRWVARETAILWKRYSLNPAFKLIPVRLPDVELDELQGGSLEDLAGLQHVESGNAAEIASQVAAAVGTPDLMDTPLATLTRMVAELLQVTDQVLMEGAYRRCFGDADPKGHDWKHGFARMLVHTVLQTEGGGVLDPAVDVLNSLSPVLRKENARPIVRLLAPMWVDEEAAAKIPGVENHSEHVGVALNGTLTYDYTADMYLGRAYPHSELPILIPVSDSYGASFVEHVEEDVQAYVRTRFPTMRTSPHQRLNEFVRSVSRRLFILLPCVPPEADSIEALRALYPNARYLCSVGEHLPERARLPRWVRRVEPELELLVEQDAYFSFVKAQDFVERLN